MSFEVAIDSTGLAFDPVEVGGTSSATVLVRKTGGPPRDVTIAVSAGDFSTADGGTVPSNDLGGGGLPVTLTFSASETGTRTGLLTVTWDEGEVTCALTATGLVPLEAPTADVAALDLGTLDVGATAGGGVALSVPALRTGSTLDESCTVTASVAGAGYTVSPSSEVNVAAGGVRVFTVTFAPLDPQAYPATLSLAWQRAGQSGTLDVALSGAGQTPVVVGPPPTPFDASAVPPTCAFADTFVGVTAAGSVMLHGTDETTEVQLAIEGDFTTTAPSPTTIAAGGLQIPLTFAPSVPGTRPGKLRVTWSGGSLECGLTGLGLAPTSPRLGVAELDFQTLLLGASLAAPFTFENPADPANTADETCTVTAMHGDEGLAGGYTVSPTGPQTVPEGGTQVFTVTFAPTWKGLHSAPLRLEWERGGNRGELQVQLVGRGEDPVQVDGAQTTVTGGTRVDTVVSQNLRAGWYVPTYDSYVSLGQPWTPTSNSVTTQPGFSATTTRHVFMRAAGTATFQSENGPVWFQSEAGPLYMVSGGSTSWVAKGSVYVGGGGYVGIMAGYAGEPIPEDHTASYDGGDPTQPAPISKVPLAFTVADWVWSVADKVVGVLNATYLVQHTFMLGNQVKALGKVAMTATIASQVVGLSSYILGRAMGSPKKEANFYSQAGILMGTPAFASIYGTAGVNYRSANVTLLGNVAVAVNSIGATTLDSVFGETGVTAKDVNVSCWDGVFVYATTGKQTVLGWDIKLGGFLPDGMQLPTSSLEIDSMGDVEISSKTGPTSKVALKARTAVPAPVPFPDPTAKLTLKSASSAVLDSPKTTIRLKAGEAAVWTIEASTAGIDIKNASGQAMLSLKKGGVIAVGPTGAQIQLTSGNVAVASGAMTIAPSSIVVSGFGELL